MSKKKLDLRDIKKEAETLLEKVGLIDLLDKENRDGFRDFVETKTSFNPHNMFICKKKFLKSPQWLRNIKDKKYPLWRLDVLFSDKKY